MAGYACNTHWVEAESDDQMRNEFLAEIMCGHVGEASFLSRPELTLATTTTCISFRKLSRSNFAHTGVGSFDSKRSPGPD